VAYGTPEESRKKPARYRGIPEESALRFCDLVFMVCYLSLGCLAKADAGENKRKKNRIALCLGAAKGLARMRA
jgi:hypothetical protein